MAITLRVRRDNFGYFMRLLTARPRLSRMRALEVTNPMSPIYFARDDVDGAEDLKAFLTALAIFDDIGAVLIIGLFYASLFYAKGISSLSAAGSLAVTFSSGHSRKILNFDQRRLASAEGV